jgi:subtilase family serine protease
VNSTRTLTLTAAFVIATVGAASAATTIAVPLSSHTVVRDLGRAPANYPVSIAVTLPYRNDTALEQLIQAQGDPSSPLYHDFLTPAQFATMFGPTPQDESVVVQLLERAGFRITQRSANRTLIDATASAALAERYFKTEIHLVNQAGAGIRYLNARPALVPAELLARTFSVSGLSDIVIGNGAREAVAANHLVRPDATSVGQPLQNEGGVGPLAWAQGYDFPIQHGYDGENVSVGDIEQSAPLPSGYLETYSIAFDLRKRTGKQIVVPVNGRCPGSCGGISPIVAADSEYLDALAPGSNYYLYQIAGQSMTDWEDGFNKIVSDNHVEVATASLAYGEGEPNDEVFALTLDHIVRQANALGITFVVESEISDVSSGYDLTTPGDSPHVLSVGDGTILQVNSKGDYVHESAGTGGIPIAVASAWFGLPSYQSGIKGMDRSGRNAPDIGYAPLATISGGAAQPLDFVFYSPGSGWSGDPGTAAPIVAWVAGLDQLTKKRGGLVNTTLYAVYKAQKYGPKAKPAFHQIDKAGFDDEQNFGIGSIDGWNLANDMKVKK